MVESQDTAWHLDLSVDPSEVRFQCLSAQEVNVDRQELTPDHEAGDPGPLTR